MQYRSLKYKLIDTQRSLISFLERSRKDLVHSEKVLIAIEIARLDIVIDNIRRIDPTSQVPLITLIIPSKIDGTRY